MQTNANRRPLPLVTDQEPVCQEACEHWRNGWCRYDEMSSSPGEARWVGYHDVCLPYLLARHQRLTELEQRRCDGCERWGVSLDERGSGYCAWFDAMTPGDDCCRNGWDAMR